MAGLAFFPVPCLVHVVLHMAPHAFSGWCIVEGLALVARQAACFHVRTSQWKTGLAVVESGVLPVPVVVALCAVGAEFSLVHVVRAVAAGAFLRCLLEILGAVARPALRLDVPPPERELRLVVIELCLLPVRFGMAALAVGAEASSVYVVLPVARLAIVRGLTELLFRRMARRAFHSGMLAEQQKIRKPVIEAALVQFDDFRRSAEMLGMALATGIFRQTPVMTGL